MTDKRNHQERQEETEDRERQVPADCAKDIVASKIRSVHVGDSNSRGKVGWGRAQLEVAKVEARR